MIHNTDGNMISSEVFKSILASMLCNISYGLVLIITAWYIFKLKKDYVLCHCHHLFDNFKNEE